jgi:uncharacterized alpha-E superfamily protein
MYPDEVDQAVLVMSGAAQRSNGHYDPAPPPGSIGDLIDRYNAAEKVAEEADRAHDDAQRVRRDMTRRLWNALNEIGTVVHGRKVYSSGSGTSVHAREYVTGSARIDPQS